MQYAYISDGANYKLLSFYPPDCEEVKKLAPKMVYIYEGECVAYGYWTANAKW